MPGITEATQDDLDSARYESKKEVTLGDNNDGVTIVELLKLVMIRLFTIIEWSEGIKLLNSLTTRAPIASILCNSEWCTIDDLAFKLRGGNSGYKAVMDIYDHPEFPDGDGHTYADLAAAAGLDSVLSLASTVLRVVFWGNVGFCTKTSSHTRKALFFSRCSSCLTITTWWMLSR